MSRNVEDPEKSTRPLWDLLRERYPKESHAMFREVRNETGVRGDRAADAVAMGLWPSHGLEVLGFEFKASRSDWLRELKNPRKSNGVFPYCHRWWLVVTGSGIADVDELPSTWGLLMARKDGLRAIRQAPQLEPQPMAPGFIASLLRSAQRQVEQDIEANAAPLKLERHTMLQELREEVRADHARALEEVRGREQRQYREVVEGVTKFEQISGIPLWETIIHQRWKVPDLALVAKFLRSNATNPAFLAQLKSAADAAADAHARIAELQAAIGEPPTETT